MVEPASAAELASAGELASTTPRTAMPPHVATLTASGVHPLLARLYAARGVEDPRQLATELSALVPLDAMLNVGCMAILLADAIARRDRILIVADYDSDGATACAVGMRALRAFGAEVDFLVPNRFEYGYGLTPEIVALAHRTKQPRILVTVDNGIASIEGVAAANRLGLQVLVTDHHLPGASLPDALCIINPNQPGCGFPSKHLAGVGVMFYLMLALRAELRERGAFAQRAEPNLAALLDLVALGTVADVVRLDDNNRILVRHGLDRIRRGKTWAGIAALMRVAGRDCARASTYDLGFVLGPRLNAAGRLADMSLGIECLLTDDDNRADELARRLDALNRERREIESGMHEEALAAIEHLSPAESYTLCLFDPAWHQGVIGILASRLKERWHRPVIAFARGAEGELKGSGRSIGALHLRDALDLVAKREQGLLTRFGGHAAAAGLTLRESDLGRFQAAFEAAVRTLLTAVDLKRVIETDGELEPGHCTLEAARMLEQSVWGQGFPPPTFEAEFAVADQRIVGSRHLKLRLLKEGHEFDAMLFGSSAPLPARVRAIYRLEVNEYNGQSRLQLTLEHCRPL